MAKRKTIHISKKKRVIRPTIILLGDGETEESYINRLKELNLFNKLTLKFEKGNEFNFETKIKEHAMNKNVIVIIDVDNVESNTTKYNLIKRLVETKKYKGQVFFNNYSFECWLISHVTYFSTPIANKTQYDDYMKENFGIESWSKNKNERNRKLVMNQIHDESIHRAVVHVKRLNQQNPFENPSSNMDECIGQLTKRNKKK